jgi:hypothetical protein
MMDDVQGADRFVPVIWRRVLIFFPFFQNGNILLLKKKES